MNRQDLIEIISNAHGLSKAEAGRILITITDGIMASVKKGEAVSLVGFGSFKKVARASRTGFNPQSKKTLKIPARAVPKFTPGAQFKALVDPKDAKRRAAKK